MRDSLLLVGLFVAGAAAVGGYSYFTRVPAADAARGITLPFRTAIAPGSHAEARRSPGPSPLRGETTQSGDDDRVAAVEALGKAPPVKAIPALQKVISTTADEVEWRAALRTLGTLARGLGDPDESIRNGLREVISHTSNEALILGAQDTLDEIDRAAFEAATGRPATPDVMRGAVAPEGTAPSAPPSDE